MLVSSPRVCGGNAIAEFAQPLEWGRIPAEMQSKGQIERTEESKQIAGGAQVDLKFVSRSNAKALAQPLRGLSA